MGRYEHHIPDDAHLRRILVLMETSEANAHRDDPWYGAIVNHESIALVLIDPDSPIDHPVMRRLERSGLHGRKRVLALNPFDADDYKEPETLVLGLPVAKATIMRSLCQVLGATSFEMDMMYRRAKSSTWHSGVDATRPKGGGGAMIKRAMADLWQAKASISGTYEGGEPDVVRAKVILEQSGLDLEPEVAALLHAAENRANRVTEQVCRIEAVSEATRTVELTAKAIVPSVIECKGDFKFESEERTDYTLKFTVRWQKQG